jgi:hypothetical protein
MKKQDVTVWTGFSWLKTALPMDSCEHGNELPGSIKAGISSQLSDYQFLNESAK